MLKTFRRTAFLFLIVLILPTIIFSLYELGSLKVNEQVIESIYNNQLDAILFSVNQYSDDVINSWAGRFERITSNGKDVQINLDNFTDLSSPIRYILQFESNYAFKRGSPKDSIHKELINKVSKTLINNDTTVRRLQTYLRGGYRKIVGIGLSGYKEELIVFASENKDEKNLINVFVLNPEKFITQILDPKIQEIARGKFYIIATNKETEEIIYSSDKNDSPESVQYSKPFWILPRYSFGIELKDITISDLASSRLKKDITALIIVDLVLILGIWIIFRNVRKQMELSQLKSDFVSNVSHEIRTPLALISMYIETLEMGRIKAKEKIDEYYSIILQETRRLSGIVNKILNFSQIESGKRTYNFDAVNLNNNVEEVLLTYKFSLDNKGFKCSCECIEDLPLIKADREAVTDAIMNLVDNAIKYSGDIKEIRLKTGKVKEKVFFEIEDSGIGISEKEQKYIYDKFYRVTEKNLALKAKGSGLGLAIVKHIIDAHNGKIELISQKGKGARFRLYFPIYKSEHHE
ncbi:MAG: HAMP domain-containing histidine kinase [Bacteroidales bacterium]|nr:HAMP domain-containing histidine kinase [Bacteroidales bacterium]